MIHVQSLAPKKSSHVNTINVNISARAYGYTRTSLIGHTHTHIPRTTTPRMASLTVDMAIAELASVGELCTAQLDVRLEPNEVHRDMCDACTFNIGSLEAASHDQKQC